MFAWIKSSQERRRLAKRGIYRFWDGETWRYADPLRIWQGLFLHPTLNLERDLPFVDTGVEPQTSNTLGAISEAFGVQRFDSATKRGLTAWEIVDLVDTFFAWLELQKKSTSPGPISGEP